MPNMLKEIFNASLDDGDFHADLWVPSVNAKARAPATKYSPDQPRDESGRFGEGSGSSTATEETGSETGTGSAEEFRQRQQETPEFKAWFGESKVVDEDGKPLVVYHGTRGEFNEFKPDTENAWSDALGFDTYFHSEGKATASTYSSQFEDGHVMENYLSIQKPLEIDANGGEWVDAVAEAQDRIQTYRTDEEKEFLEYKQEFTEKYAWEISEAEDEIPAEAIAELSRRQREIDQHVLANPELYRNAKRQPFGYDGIIVKNVMDMTAHEVSEDIDSYNPYTTVYVAFKGSQIKSATANDGAFDPNSRDITKSARPTGTKYDPDQPRDELGRFGEGGSGEETGSESMIIEPSEQNKKDEDRYKDGVAAWERYRDTRERMRTADGTDDWDRPGGLKQRMEEATHIDKLGSKLKRMQGAVKAQLTKYGNLRSQASDLEEKRNNLANFIATKPTNPVTGESTAHEYEAELAELETQISDLVPKIDAAYAAYEKIREGKMDRMVEAVREGIKERMQDQLAIAQRVSMQPEPGNKSQEAIDKAKSLLSGCVSEKVDWKAATCAIKDCDAAVYGGNRAYFSPGNIHDQANMTLGTMALPEGGADYKTVIHEYGHCLEQDYKVASACQAFLWHRVGNESPVSMQDAAPNRGYDKYELGRKDEFDKAFSNEEAHYIGKFYQSGGSEVLSMGMEKLFYNPREFAEKDPEYFKFVIGILDGSLL